MRWAVATILCLASTGGIEAQEVWKRLAEPPPAPILRIPEGSDWLEARGDRLVRVGQGHETVLTELPDRPTGRINALWDDPHGGTFVAADNGLFTTHPSVDTIDRLDLRDGAPRGALVGLVLDQRRRLWLATETSFGVVDTLFFFGRTHGPEDGLPPGPYQGLSFLPEEGLVLHTAAGAWSYRPNQGDSPAVTEITIDGEPWSGEPLQRSWPFGLRLAARAEGRGGATLRWVEDNHHNWQSLPSEGIRVSGMSPGRRSLGLVAFDRDMRRSAQITVPVDVVYPSWLEPRNLVSMVLVASLAVLTAMLLGARRAGGGGPRYARAAISAGLIVWAVLQLVAALFPHVRGWPFCGFSMYTWSAQENAVSGPVALVGVTEEGRTLEAEVRRFGLPGRSPWPVIRPFLNGDTAHRRGMLERYNQRSRGRELSSLSVVQSRQRLTREGKIQVAPLVMGVVESGR